MIRVADLTVAYGEQPILEGLDFTIETGEFVGLLGPNGSGKSTLINALSGVVPLKAGQVWYNGTPLGDWTPRRLARQVAVVPQFTWITFPFTCYEVVLMGRYAHRPRFGGDSEADREAVRQALAATGTLKLAGRSVTELSGGERQLVILARALAQDTPVLLLDEATAALDVRHKLEVFDLLSRLNRKRRLTILAVMHDLNLATQYCRRLIFLKDRRIYHDSDTISACRPEILSAVFDTPALVQPHPATGLPCVYFLSPQPMN